MEFIVNGQKYTDYDAAKKAEDAFLASENHRKQELTELIEKGLIAVKMHTPKSIEPKYIAILAPTLSENDRNCLFHAAIEETFGPQYMIHRNKQNISGVETCYTYGDVEPDELNHIKAVIFDALNEGIMQEDINYLVSPLTASIKVYSYGIKPTTATKTENKTNTAEDKNRTAACNVNCGHNCDDTCCHKKDQNPITHSPIIKTPFGNMVVHETTPEEAEVFHAFLHRLFG